MLKVLAVFGDEGGAEFGKRFAEGRGKFGANEIFDGLFRGGVGINVYVELGGDGKGVQWT